MTNVYLDNTIIMGMSQILKMVIMFLTLLFLLQLASTSDACNCNVDGGIR